MGELLKFDRDFNSEIFSRFFGLSPGFLNGEGARFPLELKLLIELSPNFWLELEAVWPKFNYSGILWPTVLAFSDIGPELLLLPTYLGFRTEFRIAFRRFVVDWQVWDFGVVQSLRRPGADACGLWHFRFSWEYCSKENTSMLLSTSPRDGEGLPLVFESNFENILMIFSVRISL